MLCQTARAAIDELRSMGVTDLTPDEIVTVSDLARTVENAAASLSGGAARAFPVVVAGVKFMPPTCAAEDWISRFSDVARSSGLALPFYAYALAHGREPEAFDHATPRDAAKAVRRWWKALPLTAAEVDSAIDALACVASTTARAGALHGFSALESFFRGNPEAKEALSKIDQLLSVKAKPEAETQQVSQFWRNLCLRLSGMVCGDVESWYYRSRDEALRLFGYAMEIAALKAGDDSSASEKAPVVEIRALRAEIARIEKTRKAVDNGGK